MSTVDDALARLDDDSVNTVRRALATLGVEERAIPELTPLRLASLVRDELPRAWPVQDNKEHHEVVWALGDFFAAADLGGLATVCRDPHTHRLLATSDRVNLWFAQVSRRRPGYFDAVVPLVTAAPTVPEGAELSLAPAVAFLEAVGDGLGLTKAGYLPPRVALAIDERFGWSAEHPWQKARGESDIPRLRFVHQRLRDARLLTKRKGTLTVSAEGRRCLQDTDRLWAAVTGVLGRTPAFDAEAQALTCALLLMHDASSMEEIDERVAAFLEQRWRGEGGRRLTPADVRWAHIEWYRFGLAFDWFQQRGLYDTRQRLSEVGRSAAVWWLRSVAAAAPTSGPD